MYQGPECGRRENVDHTSATGTGKDFLNWTLVVVKLKTDKQEATKPLCRGRHHSNEETIYRMGGNFSSHTSGRGLASTIYKELKNLNVKKTNNPIIK